MTVNREFSRKALSIMLCIALLLSYLPMLAHAAPQGGSMSADQSTMEGWRDVFKLDGGNLDTENAGGVWTDKSVFTKDTADATAPNSVLNQLGLKPGADSFMVVLSAMASNMTISGQSSVPTDTMLVLDVSGSMNDENNDVASELATATNATIYALLEANSSNRVGVVFYSGPNSQGSSSGNDALVALPLGRYTTGDSQGRFFNYNAGSNNSYESISLNNQVVIEGTQSKPTSASKSVRGGTYIQNGLDMAKKQFLSVKDTTATDSSGTTVKRKPVLVLLSDGAPTLGSTGFTNIGSSNLGNGMNSSAAIGFVTQLTAAYVKQQLEEHYGNESLFYTLGVGISSSMDYYNIAEYVLNPLATTNNQSANGIRSFWTSYNNPQNTTVTVSGNGNNARRVTIIDEPLEQYYVDKYFNTANYGTNLQQALGEAFKDIVADIEKQSAYFPTFVGTSANASGFVSFVDKIGQYMKVSDIKGITVGDNKLFSGLEMSKALLDGTLGTATNPTDVGDNFVWAVQERMGIATPDEARALIGVAYDNGQLAYNSTTGEYSNFIGWCADSLGAYLGHWYEGMDSSTIPAGTKYIVKSYGYLGETDGTVGVTKSDLMYAVVQVREDIATGEQQLTFSIPAALVPVVTYDVSLDEQGECDGIVASGATAPMRLVYEIELDSRINEYTMSDIVDEQYLASNTVDGKVNFYTNQYEADLSTGFDATTGQLKVNTYSYFKPAMENDRYYFQNNSRIYTESLGIYTAYTDGSVTPKALGDSGTKLYRKHLVYKQTGTSTFTNAVNYAQLSSAILEDAKFVDGEWIIEGGHVRMNTARYNIIKDNPDLTGTLPYANEPFVDIGDPHQDNSNHRYTVGSTLGNNGRISLVAKTGIKLTKSMADGVTAPDKAFSFKLTAADSFSATLPAYRVKADGTAVSEQVTFTAGVADNVTLMAGDSLYIEGMADGQIITVNENVDLDYAVSEVYVGGIAQTGKSAQVEIKADRFTEARFVNGERGIGNLTVAKEVEHPFDTDPQAMATKQFTMEVTLTLEGVPLANKSYNGGAVTTDSNGKVVGNVILKHGQQLEIYGLPAGTVATVREISLVAGDGFTPVYYENGVVGQDNSKGVVTVEQNHTVSVIVANKYQPASVIDDQINITLKVSKNLTGRTGDNWTAADSYTFELQRRNAENTAWITLSTKQISAKGQIADFTAIMQNETFAAAGRYYYRVIEQEPTDGTAVAGVDYDKAIHAFYVVVADSDMDGRLEIADVVAQNESTTSVTDGQNGQFDVAVSFTNVYQTEATNASIEIQKTVANPSGSPLGTADGFKFKIYSYSQSSGIGAEVAETPPTSITGITRTSIRYTAEGVYHYAIKEVDTNRAGWSYSNTTAYVTVVVADDGNGNLVARAYEGLGSSVPVNAVNSVTVGNSDGYRFINTYTPATASVELDFVNKKLTGRDYSAGEFEFIVEGYGYDMIDANGDKLDGNKIVGRNSAPDADGNSKVAFTPSKLYFNKVGIYYHNITEVNGGLGGITYDNNVCRVTVTVTDNGGILSATYELVNIAGDQLNFVNTYLATPAQKSITATKVLTGRALVNNEFTFIMQQSDSNGNVKADGATYEAKNALDGSVSFPVITYNQAGTYHYLVSEKQPAEGTDTYGLSYDTRKFIVSVSVTDNGEGALVAANPTYKLVGNGVASGIVFNNTYTAAPTGAVIPGNKVLTGRVWNNDVFDFELYGSNENWAEGSKLETTQNATGGAFSFKEISFNKVGTYYYLVKEVNAGRTIKGITYDDTVFRVKIVITDDLRGRLHSSVYVYDGNDIPQAGVEFNNLYTVTGTGTVTLEGKKTLEGRNMVDGEFTFEMYKTDNNFAVSGDAFKTASNKSGKFEFKLDYTPEDIGKTYYYVVKEKGAGSVLDGVNYASTQYQVTVTVEDDGIGSVKTTATVFDGQRSVDSLDFVNKFTANTSVNVTVNKKVENKGSQSITAEGFEFRLRNVATDEKLTAASDANGNATFTLPFTQADIGKTYTYELTELDGKRAHVTYSTAKYTVEVAVSLGADNKLVVALKQNGAAVESVKAEFINQYDYTPPATTPSGPKTGDTTNLNLWLALLFVSGGGFICTTVCSKKRRQVR